MPSSLNGNHASIGPVAASVSDELKRAVQAGIDELVARHGSQMAVQRRTGILQKTVSAAKKGSIGIKTAQQVAVALETTLDGLVRRYRGEEVGGVYARDVIGWDRTVEEARRRGRGKRLPAWAWERAGDIRLPVAPSESSVDFALSCAELLADHVEVTAVVARPQIKNRH